MKRFQSVFTALIAISAGIIVLLGYFIEIPAISGLRMLLLQWSIILAGVALLIGVLNLISVHWRKVHKREPGSINSFVLLFFLLLTVILGILPGVHSWQGVLLNGILVPVEISLMAVLSVTLIYAAVRLLKNGTRLSSIIFLLTVFVLLFLAGPILLISQSTLLGDGIRSFIQNDLVSGGARGILIGVALGTITTGLRVLLGVDRPYGGK